tara:strand:- start:11610 stop:12773 length:1164 start_codon:yes stop_codon:yes gene_type:complete
MPGFELIGEEERKALNELFDDGGVLFAHGFDNIRNNRYRVREFEKQYASYLGVKYAQAVSSGTAALKIALRALGVKQGDEVITQAFTFIAVAEAIIDLGAKPIFINIDETLNMDPNALEKEITKKTKAIITVNMLGVAVDQDKIFEIAKKNNIPVLDDSCESFGAEWNNDKLGTLFDITAWSFDAGKTIIAGEGGMITTNDKELFKMCREIHDHGHMYDRNLPRGRDTHRTYGFNYRMTEMQAAVLSAQLKKIDYIVDQNRKNYNFLKDQLSGINQIEFRKIPINCKPLCDTLIFRLENIDQTNSLLNELNLNGIGTKNVPDAIEWHFAIYWDHMLDHIGLSINELKENLNVSNKILKTSIALPVMIKDTEISLSKKAKVIKNFFNK